MTILLHNATLVNVERRTAVREGQEVLIQDGKITQIGKKLAHTHAQRRRTAGSLWKDCHAGISQH